VRKVFFPLTDRRENRNPIILAIRGIELILAYALIFGAAVFARPTLNVHLIDDYVATALFVRMCRVMRLRVFITCHDVYPHDLEIGASRISILCNADRLIVHTKDAERQLLGLLGAPAESRIKRCAFPFSSYDDLVPNDREKEKVLDSLPHDYFLFVGVVRLSKGIDLLIDAWSQMPPDRLDQLVIAGKWPAKLGDLRTQAEALPHCTVLDRYMTDIELSSLIGGASWVVLPYRRYTHSSILFSCLNAGIPVIVSDCELFRETLPGYELTFSEQNSSDLVRVLIRASESDIRPRCISHLQEIHRNHLNELISTIGDAYC
jgi:glycosyltransferase involved in cell wall biosynthesis